MTRPMAAMALVLTTACGKEKDFDVEAYCEQHVPCFNDAQDDFRSTSTTTYGTFEPYQLTVDECIFNWEAERDIYTDAGCGAEWDEVEYCFANEKDMKCYYGSWAASACLGEVRLLSDCVQEKVWDATTY